MIGVQKVKSVKVYVMENKDAFVACPHCGFNKSINLSQILSMTNFKNTITFNCKCGNPFSVSFDRREFYRKPVNVTGLCFSAGDPKDGVAIKILDISMSGVCFIKEDGKELVEDEVVRLEFRIGQSRNMVTSLVSTITVKASNIGAKFINLDEYTRKTLGFFLLP